jgi:outer membrane murein-binding lipoprotein Lpp
MVEYEKTETEYLVWVSTPEERSRICAISGAWFDGHRDCWVLPVTEAVQKALRSAFRQAKRRAQPPREGRSLPARPTQPASQPAQRELQKAVAEISQLKATLARLETSLEAARESERAAQEQAVEWQRKAEEAARELRQANSEQGAQLVFETVVKQIALEAAERDPEFERLVKLMKLDEMLPIRLQGELEAILCQLVQCQPYSQELAALIKQIKEGEHFEREVIDLFYLVKAQRNAVAHPRPHRHTLPARVVMALFAFATVWGKVKRAIAASKDMVNQQP